jgi:hypothetical protein
MPIWGTLNDVSKSIKDVFLRLLSGKMYDHGQLMPVMGDHENPFEICERQ